MEPAWKKELNSYPPIGVRELPEALRAMVEYQRPISPMFPEDFVEMMALTFWSVLFPTTKVENLGLNLWFLGINPQGSGKNITSDELHRIVKSVNHLKEREMMLFTGGSAEGMARRLEGTGKSLLAYHAEYAGFLKSLRQMGGSKEMLCNLYDGRDVSHQLTGGGVEAIDPHVVVVATTTMHSIMESGNREDLQNGYLSRFMFCAPDSLDIGPGPFPTELERADLAVRLAHWLDEAGEVALVALGRGANDAIDDYKQRLGMHTGRLRDLDRERGSEETPPGRLVARVKKIGALLALADCRATILEGDVRLAIRFTGRANAYQRRVAQWIGASKESVVAARVVERLGEAQAPLTARELQQYIHGTKATEMKAVLDDLVQADELEAVPQGRTTVYRLARKG